MHVVIIGNGISGISAARFIRKYSNWDISVISAESDYFYSRTALMYIYMGHIRQKDTQPYEPWFWEKNRIKLINDVVEKLDGTGKTLQLRKQGVLPYDHLIIATGSKSNKFGWPGQDLQGVGGLYHLQDLERMEAFSQGLQRAVVVGGGLIGIEMAEMFHSRHIPVSFLVRENSYWNNVLPAAESAMINRHIIEQGIDLRLNTSLQEILDDGQGKAAGVITHQGEQIKAGFVGLTAGVSPNIGFLAGSGIETNKGVLVNEYLETSLPDVYAIGDCAELRSPLPGRRAIEAIWYTGRMMGETLAYTLCQSKIPYNPGIWFNSAKFFDIEYQVYGDVPAKPAAFHTSIYWEHPGGKKSIRLVFNRHTGAVLGFNLMGIRYRQEFCEKWIKEGAHVEKVLPQLALANFDPEFFASYEKELLALYNEQFGSQLRLQSRRGLFSIR